MTAHAVIRQRMPASCAQVFDLIHDYPRRLTWDTLLRAAYTIDGVAPGVGVESVCSARWRLGGLSFRTRYVTFRRPELAGVTLVEGHPLFPTWAASIRHHEQPGGSEVVYTLTFGCRPRFAARVMEAVAVRMFRWETGRRLRSLAAHLAAQETTGP